MIDVQKNAPAWQPGQKKKTEEPREKFKADATAPNACVPLQGFPPLLLAAGV